MAKNLDFQQEGDIYVANTDVNDDYNVHVECDEAGTIIVQHKTSGDEYANVHIFAGVVVVDDDFDGIVYPKQIRITSTKPVKKAIITEVE